MHKGWLGVAATSLSASGQSGMEAEKVCALSLSDEDTPFQTCGLQSQTLPGTLQSMNISTGSIITQNFPGSIFFQFKQRSCASIINFPVSRWEALLKWLSGNQNLQHLKFC